MRSKIIFALLAILLNCCSSASAQEVQKLKCPIIEGIASFVCPTEFDDYCVYFTGDRCDSTLCAKLTANSCTACSVASSVSYYTESPCNASKVFCDDYARPHNCSATDNPVCAYYSSDDCPNGLCSQTARNPCEACGSQFAEYYKSGECTDPSQYTCNARTLFGQHVNAGPVCAFFTESCPIDLCNRTVISAAQACEDPSVLYYKLGKCENETLSCSNVDTSSCQLDYHPVCITVKGCTDIQCAVAAQTFDNDCLACSNSSYQYYASGICLEDQRQCPSQDEVSDLPQDYEPVCAFFSFGGSQTYNNSYSACSQSTPLAYYVNGPCSFNCDEVWTKFIMIPCIGLPVSPVCGYYTEGCSSSDGVCQESFVNSCYGCSTGKLGHFTDGLCPKNQSIYCEPGVSPGSCAVIDPVCAVFEEDCNDASCRQTYQNPCQACEDPTIVSYKPGLCSGDNGVPCDPSNRPIQASCKDVITVGPVCGVTDKNCNDASCRQTFNNTCLACADSSIIQFTNGECSA